VITDGWIPKRVWKKEGKHFCVEIVCTEDARRDEYEPYTWCVYAYIYPKHWLFDRIPPHCHMWETNTPLECHSYVSYFRTHTDKHGEITSHQIGWDYNHHGDSHYCQDQEGSSVFWDAENLFTQLSESSEERGDTDD